MTLPSSSPDANRNPTIVVFDSSTKLPLGLTAQNLTNANALHVAIVDNTGTQITSFGGGTQYTAGAVQATPVGTLALGYDGSNVRALLTNSAGDLFINIDKVGGSAISLGQALAAASLPVILPSATITTLTPPSNTGYALDTSLSTIDTDLKANITLHAGTNLIGKVGLDQTTPGTTNAISIAQIGANTIASAGQNGVLSVGGQQATNNNISTNGFPILIAGSDYGGTPKIQSIKVDSSGNQQMNVTQIGGSSLALGQTTMSASLPVALASNQSAISLWGHGATGATAPTSATLAGGIGLTTLPTAVTTGQQVGAMADKYGRQIVMGGLRELKGNQKTTIASSTSETTIITAGGTGVFCDLYGLILSNTSATAVNVTIKDSTSGTTRFIIPVPANDVRGFMLPQDSAHVQSSANNNWTATCSTSIANLEVTALFVNNK